MIHAAIFGTGCFGYFLFFTWTTDAPAWQRIGAAALAGAALGTGYAWGVSLG